MKEDSDNSGMDLCSVLFIVFLVLKLCKLITWSWWWVFAPLWIPIGIVVILFILAIIVAIIVVLFE